MSAESKPVPPALRVLVVEDDSLVGMQLKSHLQKLGHVLVGQAATAPQALEIFRQERPDLVLLDVRLDGTDGLEVAGQLMAERLCPMIVISAYSDKDLVERAAAVGVFGYLVKPINLDSLQAQILVAMQRFGDQERLRLEKEALVQALETRKLVERAKGILMKHLSLSEDTAHRRLQQESQKRRINIAEVARKIIESEELLGN